MTSEQRGERVVDNRGAQQFELQVGDAMAVARYRRNGDTITFTHTLVPDALRGGGVGSTLARGALDAARAEGLRVVAQCPFIAAYIARHREYQPLVEPQE